MGLVLHGVAVPPAGTFVYVAGTNGGSRNSLCVIDTATNTVITTVQVGINPFGVAVHPLGTEVYVANQESNSVCDRHGDPYRDDYRAGRSVPSSLWPVHRPW
jgi:YVTN family beta-propeller protein